MRVPLMALSVLLSISTASSGQDWSGWRGAARDGHLAGFEAPAVWPKSLALGWQVDVGEGHATPALVGGRLYVFARQGEDEVTLCLEAATGKELWRHRHAVDARFMLESSAKSHGRGPFASPLVTGGKVLTFGIRSTLSSLDASSGKLLWRHDFDGEFPRPYAEWGSAASPIVFDGACIVHAGGGPGKQRAGDGRGAVLAFDIAGGKRRWSWDGDCAGFASPIVATIAGRPQLITLTESLVVGLSPADGRLLWQEELKSPYQQNSVSPVVHGSTVIVSGTGLGTRAYRLGGDRAEHAWQTTDVSMYMSTPVLKGDRLFGFSEKRKGLFFCLDASRGEVLWSGPPRQGENAALLCGGDVMLALTTSQPEADDPSHLVVFDASDKQYSERARYRVADTPAWAHPVVSGKSIFVKDRTKLTQWLLPSAAVKE